MKANGLLQSEDLRLYFRTNKGTVQAVDSVSFKLGRNEALAVIGESGCGKTSLARAILRLLPRNVHTYTGQVFLDGLDMMKLNDERFRQQIRWVKISLVSQSAMNSLNPVIKVGQQLAEPLVTHQGTKRKTAHARAMEVLQLVGVPVDFLNRYSFELSGGMRQRVIIAMALITNPDLVILDEPTSALDVLTQANIMNKLKSIKKELGISFIFITHDVATTSELADRGAVMYAGQLVEVCNATQFYLEPLHPYSQKLMASIPTLRENEDKELEFIPGQPPSLVDPPTGCRFASRCHRRFDKCEREPPMFELEDGRRVKCWLYE